MFQKVTLYPAALATAVFFQKFPKQDVALGSFCKEKQRYKAHAQSILSNRNTAVPGFRVLGFSALPGFRALKAGDGAWSVHKTLFGFRAPLSQLFI